MTTDPDQPPAGVRWFRLLRVGVVVVAAALAVGLGPLGAGSALSHWIGSLARPEKTVAAASSPPRSAVTATRQVGGCALRLSGQIADCADQEGANACLENDGGQTINLVLRYHGQRADYLLYVMVLGLYTGPHDYVVSPWERTDGSPGDRVTKVAVRIYDSGELYQSTSGTLTILPAADHQVGFVTADLVSANAPAAGWVMNVSAHWSCVP